MCLGFNCGPGPARTKNFFCLDLVKANDSRNISSDFMNLIKMNYLLVEPTTTIYPLRALRAAGCLDQACSRLQGPHKYLYFGIHFILTNRQRENVRLRLTRRNKNYHKK